MTKPKTPARARKPALAATTKFVHENNEHNGQHRIVVIHADGSTEKGAWFNFQQIAEMGVLRAATSFYAGNLPEGIFTLKPIATVTL